MRTTSKGLWSLIVLGLGAILILSGLEAIAGFGGGFRNQAVGGIRINAEGLVAQPVPGHAQMLRAEVLKELNAPPAGLKSHVELRKVSLRGLDRAIAEAYANNAGVLPQEVEFLGGLQRIQYIFVYPEQNDIVLVGPGEGWTVDPNGNVVGETTGRPVLRLDDLLVALRTAHTARTEGISCSIDPTPEGRRNLEAFLKTQRVFNRGVKEGVERALGLQQVTLTGVPQDSRFARMMVAADYRMKRYGMGLEPAPVKGLPSYLEFIKSASTNLTPRWWMACNYEPVLRSEDGLAWELRGPGVKVLTEDEFIADDGTVKGTGKASGPAERWARLMTEKYEELAGADPVFGELRNLMDMCVVAALITKHDLTTIAGCELPMLLKSDGGAALASWHAPRVVATQCSFVKRGSNYVISASGGVQIESWDVAANQEVSEKIANVRAQSASATSSWWWN